MKKELLMVAATVLGVEINQNWKPTCVEKVYPIKNDPKSQIVVLGDGGVAVVPADKYSPYQAVMITWVTFRQPLGVIGTIPTNIWVEKNHYYVRPFTRAEQQKNTLNWGEKVTYLNET